MEPTETINVSDILVGERLRKDYGNISDLADSIDNLGLIQPIVLDKTSDGKFMLIAGGRRLAACAELGISELHHGVTGCPHLAGFVFTTELPDDVRRELELEENVRRRDMSWQERALAIAEIHQLKSRNAAIARKPWGYRETGDLIGVSMGHVSWTLNIAALLKAGDTDIVSATSIRDAMDILLRRKEDEALQKLASISAPKQVTSSSPTSAATPVAAEQQEGETLTVPLSQMFFNGDCRKLMNSMPPDSVDHIISDWPYAIEMDTLAQGMDMSRVEDTHDVDANLTSYPGWLDSMFRILKPGGFCVLFYDNVHFHLICEWAEYTGFRVQRWPLVWIKTHQCMNQSAHKNFTKATEFAIMLAKGNATIPKPVAKNFWAGSRDPHTSNPFAKPAGLWTWLYESLCLRGQSVLDPFMGEGSATLAAIKFGLRPIGFELEPHHYNQALTNIRACYNELTKGKVTFT